MIEKLLYCCNEYGDVFWSASEELEWKEVKGLQAVLMFFLSMVCTLKLSSFGANIMLFSIAPLGGCLVCRGFVGRR